MGTTRPTPPGVTEIFSEYVRRRQQRDSPEAIINYLKPLLKRLREDARRQLAALIRSWESREGGKYEPLEKRAAFYPNAVELLNMLPDEDLSWLPAPDAADPKTRPVPIYDVNGPVHPSVQQEEQRSPERVIHCPSCGRPNRFGEAHCYHCGAMLNVSSSETRNLTPADADLEQVGRSHFGQSWLLVLHILGEERPLALRMGERPDVILGRSAPGQPASGLHLDLSPFQAAELGVSRSHARLRYQDNTITLTDLGSVNHTYVNGQRLHPHEVRVLRDGDEIRLGRLLLRAVFQHQVRPLK